ncbi:hypothetical protein SHO565_71900 [Streptomyces sp. HO565]
MPWSDGDSDRTDRSGPGGTAPSHGTGARLVADHDRIGHLCLITSFGFLLVAGVPAMVVRAELARPGLQLLSHEQYNQAFTVHGTIMLLLFATPAFAGSPTRSCRCRSARPAFNLHHPYLARRDQKETTRRRDAVEPGE